MLNSDTQSSAKEIEDVLLYFSQEVSEKAYDRFACGDLSQEELHGVYELLSQWTREAEKLLAMLN